MAGYHTNFCKSTAFYPYFGRKINRNESQSRDKMLLILQNFVLYPAMMVPNDYGLIDWPMLSSAFFPPCFLTFYSNASKCMFSTLFPYFL